MVTMESASFSPLCEQLSIKQQTAEHFPAFNFSHSRAQTAAIAEPALSGPLSISTLNKRENRLLITYPFSVMVRKSTTDLGLQKISFRRFHSSSNAWVQPSIALCQGSHNLPCQLNRQPLRYSENQIVIGLVKLSTTSKSKVSTQVIPFVQSAFFNQLIRQSANKNTENISCAKMSHRELFVLLSASLHHKTAVRPATGCCILLILLMSVSGRYTFLFVFCLLGRFKGSARASLKTPADTAPERAVSSTL